MNDRTPSAPNNRISLSTLAALCATILFALGPAGMPQLARATHVQSPFAEQPNTTGVRSADDITPRAYLPLVMTSGCGSIPGASYGSIAPEAPGLDPSTDNRVKASPQQAAGLYDSPFQSSS